MLFDLRSRGRRRTVQVIYLGLALLMLGGLVLFGVGAGNGFGGLLNAFTNNGSSSGQTAAINQQTKAALKATQQNPSSPTAWSSLVQAYWTAAGEGSNYNSTTGTYTASGKRELAKATQAWQHYLTLAQAPNFDVAILAARAYAQLSQFKDEAAAWQFVTQSQPTAVKGYECLAFSAYAAKQNRLGDLAAGKALKLAPKLQQLTLKQAFAASKTQTGYAQQC